MLSLIQTGGGSGGVTSITGDVVVYNNSASTGAVTLSLIAQVANKVFAGPTSGGNAAPTFRSIVGADLPNPSSSTLGGVQSAAAVSHQWIDSISTSGVPHLSQPAFIDISGTVAATQLPNPSATTLGGIQSLASTASKWINAISTAGVPSATQPAFSDISGQASLTTQVTGVLPGANGGSPLIASPGYLLLPWKRFATTTNYTTNALAANGVVAVLLTINEMITINSAHLGVVVNTAATTGSFYIGIYDTSGNRLVQLKFAIGNNTTGVVAATITTAGYVLVPGTYIYVFGSDISSANLTVCGMEISNITNSLGSLLNAASTRIGFKTSQISGGNLPSSGLTLASLTAAATTFTGLAACVVSA